LSPAEPVLPKVKKGEEKGKGSGNEFLLTNSGGKVQEKRPNLLLAAGGVVVGRTHLQLIQKERDGRKGVAKSMQTRRNGSENADLTRGGQTGKGLGS